MSGPRPLPVRLGRIAALVVAAAAGLLLVGNGAILGVSLLARETTVTSAAPELPGIDNLEAVDARLWRGAAPSEDGYRALARAGVGTVVDLRAEDGIQGDAELVRRLGMRSVSLPIRDGQAPDPEQVGAFLRAVADSDGPVFVHCGAGVGRTSTMVGAWLVREGGFDPLGALRRNLAVGPPSLEQLAFVAGLDRGGIERPNSLVTAASRVLDAPRRLWHVVGL